MQSPYSMQIPSKVMWDFNSPIKLNQVIRCSAFPTNIATKTYYLHKYLNTGHPKSPNYAFKGQASGALAKQKEHTDGSTAQNLFQNLGIKNTYL